MGKRLKGVTLTRQRNWYVAHRESIDRNDLIYEPFWRTEDIPSFGVKTKIPHFEIPYRIVHLLSQNELWAYLELIRNPLVIEVYEQYALPLEETLASAEFLGVKHPVYPGTKTPIIQTIDFMCDMYDLETGSSYQAAFPVKQPEDAMRYRTAEKLALQEAYCVTKGIHYELLLSDKLRTVKSVSLECLYRHRKLPMHYARVADRWLPNFFGCLFDDRHARTAHLVDRASNATGVKYETGVTIFYNALWHKKIEMNWLKPLKLEMAASDLGLYPNV